jgi:hypothetical protein
MTTEVTDGGFGTPGMAPMILRRYSVSILFERQTGEEVELELYVMHVEAVTPEEAQEKVLLNARAVDGVLPGYELCMSVVVDF